jgi:type IV pilus assembly protein PilY1
MLMTDGEGNGEDPAGVGNQDEDIDNIFVYPAHRDTTGDRLADVAMKWYKTDLASGYADKVTVQTGASTQNLDENNAQHLVTFTVAFGLASSLADPVDRTQAFSWPSGSLADMQHAAYNGRGKFLDAGNPEELVRSMQDVISNIESRKGSASAVSFNTSTLLDGTNLYFASFDSVDWKGDVTAFGIDRVTGELDSQHSWSAAEKLNARPNSEMNNRVIYTWGLESAGTNNGVLFNWSVSDPKPAINILNDFKVNPDELIDQSPFSASSDRLDFIRGDTSHDGDGLIRKRASRLGDIIHSATRFVGKPLSNWPDSGFFGVDGERYSGYQATTSRDGMVYVGANDGLLHGFRVSDGEEVLAYLPSATASEIDNSGLHYFTEVDYQHRYYVDGSPVSADIYMPPLDTDNPWRTVLVGALGGGGQGLYALDVTDPAQLSNTQAAAKKTVLWEFTSQDDDHLGFSFSDPQIAMMNNGQWAVIIGNGYNATGTDHAELKILFIEKGLDGEWATAGDYITIDTGKGSSGNKNGLSAPTLIDLDDNGTTDRIYAGDLLGNLWVFDVSGNTTASWAIPYQDGSSNPEPLFTATDSAIAQPITMKPLVVKPEPAWVADDAGNNTPNMMVYFGTGQFIATGDAVNTKQQTFYGIWDAGAPVTKAKLIQQTPISNVPSDARVFTQTPVTLAPGVELGWYVNLPETGERVVVNAFEHRGLIYFNTMTPSISPCDAGGTSWLMAVDMKTGGNPAFAAFDIDGNGDFNVDDQVSDGSTDYEVAGVRFGLGIASATAVITNEDGKSFAYISGTGGESDGGSGSGGLKKYDLPTAPIISGERRSWIQLFN